MNLDNNNHSEKFESEIWGLDEKTFKPQMSLHFFGEEKYLSLVIQAQELGASWFITHANGNVIVNGICNDILNYINLEYLGSGDYTLRVLGETYKFSI